MQFTSNMQTLRAALEAKGYSIWLVGGAVRDLLYGEDPKDFDFATDATPDEQVLAYDDADIHWIGTGLKHGTVTAVIGGEQFEVTTLRIDTEHDGRHAVVEYTREIEQDLARRDLTINAMAMTFDGDLIDPFGGAEDVTNNRVRFVGSAKDRMEEDYLRILRFIRFHQRFANGKEMDPEAVEAMREVARGLQNISVERIWSEMRKALAYDKPEQMMDVLERTGVADEIGFHLFDTFSLISLAAVAVRSKDPLVRLAALGGGHVASMLALADYWKMSGDEKSFLHNVVKIAKRDLDEERMGERLVVLEGYTMGDVEAAYTLRGVPFEPFDVPVFPLSGKDLLEEGFKPGPLVGRALREAEQVWFDSAYSATKDYLLTCIPRG